MVPESKRIRIQRFGHSSIEMPFMAGASGKGAVRQNGDLTQTRRPIETMLDRLPSRPLYPVDAEVVWFNESKCFGSVKLLDGAESYLHPARSKRPDRPLRVRPVDARQCQMASSWVWSVAGPIYCLPLMPGER